MNVSVGLSLAFVIIFTLLSVITLWLVGKEWPKDSTVRINNFGYCGHVCDSNLQQQTSYELTDSDDIKENVAYGTSLRERIQTEENEAYFESNPEQIHSESNVAYGTADHEKIRTKHNEAYEDKLIAKPNEAYATADHERGCQILTRNQAYVSTSNPKRTHSASPTATYTAVGQDEQVGQSAYEEIPVISLNYDESAPTQQLQQGNQCDKMYDYVF